MIKPPPITIPIISAQGVLNREWILYFEQLSTGDVGALWTPAYTGLTVVGTVSHSGKWYEISKYLHYFSATITSSSGGASASVAGTTQINNYPYPIKKDSVIAVANSTSNIGIGTGLAKTGSGIYLPAWTATTNTITISGMIEVK